MNSFNIYEYQIKKYYLAFNYYNRDNKTNKLLFITRTNKGYFFTSNLNKVLLFNSKEETRQTYLRIIKNKAFKERYKEFYSSFCFQTDICAMQISTYYTDKVSYSN